MHRPKSCHQKKFTRSDQAPEPRRPSKYSKKPCSSHGTNESFEMIACLQVHGANNSSGAHPMSQIVACLKLVEHLNAIMGQTNPFTALPLQTPKSKYRHV
eukprot:751625-Pelagomonas_calceolata.AAC.5